MTHAQITLTLVRDGDDAADVDLTVEARGTDSQVRDVCGQLGDLLSRAALELRQRGPKSVRPAAIVLSKEAV